MSVDAHDPVPVVSPTPQDIRRLSEPFELPDAVRLVTGANTDPAALTALRGILTGAGVGTVDKSATTSNDPRVLNVFVGGQAEGNTGSDVVLREFGVESPAGLPSGGYCLVTGPRGQGRFQRQRPVVVLDGVDAVGTFYAVQTFRQLLSENDARQLVSAVAVRDWPAMRIRGGEESFYGDPWSTPDALHQIDFLAAHKMNALLYTAANDPRTTGALWRSPYPPEQLAVFAELIAHAVANHVDFSYRIDPEAQSDPQAGICHSSPSDLDALVARYEQLWSVGIRTVSVGWDDDSGQFICSSDTEKFGSDVSPLAAAQAYVVNHVYENFILKHPGSTLITVASEYAGDGPSTYRSRFSSLIPAEVVLFWTGPQVISPTITRADLDQASAAFGGRPLLIFDNYPVNDYATDQQHLGPLVGRDPYLAGAAIGLMANEMLEEEPSLISLFTIADFVWNPAAYDANTSWARSLAEFGGAGADALRVYAENSVDSPLNTGPISPVQALITEFLSEYTGGERIDLAGGRLIDPLITAEQAPALIRAEVANPSFLTESAPWLDKLAALAGAGLAGVRGLLAQVRGDRAEVSAQNAILLDLGATAQAIPQIIAPGVYENLIDFATTETGRFLSPTPTTVTPLVPRTVLGAGAANTVSFTLIGLAPGQFDATVSPVVPAGWQASVEPATLSLPSDNRSVTASLRLSVTPPADAVGGSADEVGVSIAVSGQDTVTTTLPVQVAAVPAQPYPDLVLGSHPVGYWRLDDTGSTEADSSGNGNSGHDVDAVTHGVAGALAGSTDTAVQLAGGYVDVPNAAALAITGPFTLEAWVRPTTVTSQQAIIEKYDRPAPNGYVLRIAANGVLNAFVNGPTSLSVAAGATALTPNAWQHVVSVYDGTTLSIYLDGFVDGSVTVTQPPGAGADDVRLGARGDDTGLRLVGGLDEVAIYPVALSVADIQGHYLLGVLGNAAAAS
jgi:hypothetical protein